MNINDARKLVAEKIMGWTHKKLGTRQIENWRDKDGIRFPNELLTGNGAMELIDKLIELGYQIVISTDLEGKLITAWIKKDNKQAKFAGAKTLPSALVLAAAQLVNKDD